jgi:hypothetical protein
VRLWVVVVTLGVLGCFSKPDPPVIGGAGDASIADVQGDDATSPFGIRYVQSTSNAVIANATQVTFSSTPAAGNMIVVAVGEYQGGTPTVTDSAGNVYSQVGSVQRTPAGGDVSMWWSEDSMTATPFVVFASSVGAAQISLIAHEYETVVAAIELDMVRGSVGTSAMPVTGPVAVAPPGRLFVGVVSHDDAVSTQAGAGYTLRERPTDSPTMVPLASQDRIGDAQTTTAPFMLSAPAGWACTLATFKRAILP